MMKSPPLLADGEMITDRRATMRVRMTHDDGNQAVDGHGDASSSSSAFIIEF